MAAGASALVLTGCQLPAFGTFNPVTSQEQYSYKLWQGFFIAGVVVLVLVTFLIVWPPIRYRRKSDGIPKQTQYHIGLEIFYTVAPIIMVLLMFGFTVVTLRQTTALSSQQLTVNVTAFQWGWQFQYPNYDVKVIGIETQDPTMVLPTHKTVRIVLRSADVVHGFYVPQFLFSRFAQPGVTNQFNFDIQHAGTYRGQCTQFCGLYHSKMFFQVKAVTDSQFQSWVSGQQSSGLPSNSISHAKQQALGGAPG